MVLERRREEMSSGTLPTKTLARDRDRRNNCNSINHTMLFVCM